MGFVMEFILLMVLLIGSVSSWVSGLVVDPDTHIFICGCDIVSVTCLVSPGIKLWSVVPGLFISK